MFKKLIKGEEGFTGSELALTSALYLALIASLYALFRENQEDEFVYRVADSLKAYYVGCGSYVRHLDNADTLWASTSSGPINVTPSTLSAYLPSGFSDRAPNGQQYMCSVKRTDGSLEWAAFLYGSGNELDDVQLNLASARIGIFGGAVTSRSSSEIIQSERFAVQARSNFDGPTVEIPEQTLVAIGKHGVGGLTGDHLNKNSVPGLPEANTMNTELLMASNDISGASEFRAEGVADGDGIDASKTITLTNLSATTADGTADTNASPETIAYRDIAGNLKASDPIDDADVATKAYVDAAGGSSVPCGPTPLIGDVCDDGTVFVGYASVSGKNLYINNSSSLTSINGWNSTIIYANWALGIGCGFHTREHTIYGCIDGKSDSAFLAGRDADGTSPYTTCQNSTELGYEDWYVPSAYEVSFLGKAQFVLSHIPDSASNQDILTSSIAATNGGPYVIALRIHGSDYLQYVTEDVQVGATPTGYYICMRSQ